MVHDNVFISQNSVLTTFRYENSWDSRTAQVGYVSRALDATVTPYN